MHGLGIGVVNWYAVEDGGRVTIVDAGLPGFKRSLDSDLAALGFGVGDVEAVILTHPDSDHTGVTPVFQEAGAQVLIHSIDEPKLRKPGPKSGDAKPINFVRETWRPSLWRNMAPMVLAGALRPPKVSGASTFEDGYVLDVPGRPRVIFTPGHTHGHCAFYFEDHGALFVGDAMCTLDTITGRTGPRLIGRAFNESNEAARKSLDALEPIGASVMLFGHGEPWRDGVRLAVERARAADNG